MNTRTPSLVIVVFLLLLSGRNLSNWRDGWVEITLGLVELVTGVLLLHSTTKESE